MKLTSLGARGNVGQTWQFGFFPPVLGIWLRASVMESKYCDHWASPPARGENLRGSAEKWCFTLGSDWITWSYGSDKRKWKEAQDKSTPGLVSREELGRRLRRTAIRREASQEGTKSEHPENNVRRTVATVCTKTASQSTLREVTASISRGATQRLLWSEMAWESVSQWIWRQIEGFLQNCQKKNWENKNDRHDEPDISIKERKQQMEEQ